MTEPLSAMGKDGVFFVVHDPGGLQVELKREHLPADLVTPTSRLFVRNHRPPVRIGEGDAFSIAIDGVAEPGAITVAELTQLPRVESAAVLQCAGNGRGYFPNQPPGAPWTVGAAGLGIWGGVRFRDVVARFGDPLPGMRFLTVTGAEDDASAPRFERSIPIAKALRDVLLAYELNGRPLPAAHGGPVRLIVPGYYAVNSVKCPARAAFTAEESAAPTMAADYRISPVGAAAAEASEPTCWAMNVKSWITVPSGERPLRPGPITVAGVAFAGEHPIQRVEVTTDGGRIWHDAALLDPDLGAAAWRRFSYAFLAAPGEHTLACRATDSTGAVQPEALAPNRQGYQANGWREPAVDLQVGRNDRPSRQRQIRPRPS